MATKWSILQARLELLEAQAAGARAYLEGLDRTPCGLTCGGCGTKLETEGDFARHFTVKDSRYLNLGDCQHEGTTTREWVPVAPKVRTCSCGCVEGDYPCEVGTMGTGC